MLTSYKIGEAVEKSINTLLVKFLSQEFNPKFEEIMKTKGNTQILKLNKRGNAKIQMSIKIKKI